MKVKIGPYIDHWSTNEAFNRWLEWRHGEGYWSVDEDDYTKLDRIVEWALDRWQIVLNHTVNKIQAKRKRKVKIKIDPYDSWSADATLSPIIAPLIQQLKDNTHGAPYVDDEDVPVHLKSTVLPPVDEFETDGNHFKRWDYVLDEIIWSFTQLSQDWEQQFHTGEIDFVWTNVNGEGEEDPEGKFRRIDTGPNDSHVFDAEGHKAFSERIDNGTRLFGKYYRSLWD